MVKRSATSSAIDVSRNHTRSATRPDGSVTPAKVFAGL
jgi:hypothetical protein